MERSKRITELENLIKQEKEKILLCNHSFGDAVSETITIKEPYGFKTVGHGSDVYLEPEGYHTKYATIYCRECSKCGLEQQSNQDEPNFSPLTKNMGKINYVGR